MYHISSRTSTCKKNQVVNTTKYSSDLELYSNTCDVALVSTRDVALASTRDVDLFSTRDVDLVSTRES